MQFIVRDCQCGLIGKRTIIISVDLNGGRNGSEIAYREFV